jgi:hypothetical protein
MLKPCLRVTLLAGSFFGSEGTPVLIQGRPWADASAPASWTLWKGGRSLPLTATGAGFRVPAGQRLVIREAAFTVQGGTIQAARAAHFRITLKQGHETVHLAEVTGLLPAYLERATVRQAFHGGLLAPGGSDVCITQKTIYPAGGTVEVAFHAVLTPEPPRGD